MKKFLIILFLLLSLSAFPQDGKISLLLSPLCLADDYSFPTIQGGIEIKLSDRITSYNEFGVKYRKGEFEPLDTALIRSYGYKARTEIRYYLKSLDPEENPHRRGLYMGANVFYIKDSHTGRINYYDNDGITELVDYFAVKKNVWGLNAVMGWHQQFKNRMIIEAFGGFGVRLRKTENSNREYNPSTDEVVETTDPTIYGFKSSIDSDEGTRYLFNITCGFRIGYRL